ncbi:hypothetical protein I2W78_13940 [Streptomyces spinoverrucosus]|uniref:hypothetical protein n=1 Tax=Streptomyces spinoverrucosus TaxID=284043 RepID=UPI0018C3BF9F|nr:hypothetical protein [Streptomyces spinoverrucosus]MBG0852915.1 hypothetical protein [Streptomyces spinoverrucosus]
MAWIVALVLFVEAFGIAGLQWILGTVVDNQDMSLAGLDPDVMSLSSKIGGVAFGLYFALCGLVALLVAVRDRTPAGLGRVLLVSAAVVHGVLGAVTWGLVGPHAFLFMMVVMGLIVLLLMTYDGQRRPTSDQPQDGTGGTGDSPVSPPPAPTTP